MRITLPLIITCACFTCAHSQSAPDRFKEQDEKIDRPLPPSPQPPNLQSPNPLPPRLYQDTQTSKNHKDSPPINQEPQSQKPAFIQDGPTQRVHEWTSIEIVLSIALLLYGVFSNCLLGWLVMRSGSTWSPRAITNIFSINLIVTGALLLVVAGYSEKQVTPITNLLVSISSYLLGAATSQMPSGQVKDQSK